ncbi:hypothetical protein ACHQM5_023769 [Ranunculus cassubicifolius]
MKFSSCFNFSTRNIDFGCGFLIFGNSPVFCNMVFLFFMVILGLKMLNLGYISKGLFQVSNEKSVDSRIGVCSKAENCGFCYSKISSSNSDLKNSSQNKELCSVIDDYSDDFVEEDDAINDVLALKKAYRVEKHRKNKALLELEQERLASATSANEAMAMILRLQNELSSVKLQANQYQRLAEQKQIHDREVINHLRWIVLKHESERGVLESQLSLCRKKLKLYLKSEEEDCDCSENVYSSICDDDVIERLISSFDMESETR